MTTGATQIDYWCDLNFDGIIDGADLGIVLNNWGTEIWDLNGDGVQDGADLGYLLGQWGQIQHSLGDNQFYVPVSGPYFSPFGESYQRWEVQGGYIDRRLP